MYMCLNHHRKITAPASVSPHTQLFQPPGRLCCSAATVIIPPRPNSPPVNALDRAHQHRSSSIASVAIIITIVTIIIIIIIIITIITITIITITIIIIIITILILTTIIVTIISP
jgi:hypothetical protein